MTSQREGFAPHFDDIEAFILQVEGNKHWRLYDNPEGQKLPRFSSGNFEQKELGPVVMDLVMQPGDLLYFPRGIVHQADAPSAVHSLHITVSTYQRNSWGDLMQKAMEGALATAIEEEPRFREGLPLDFLDHVGLVHADKETPQRAVRYTIPPDFREPERILMRCRGPSRNGGPWHTISVLSEVNLINTFNPKLILMKAVKGFAVPPSVVFSER